MARQSKPERASKYRSLMDGVRTHWIGSQAIMIGGKNYTPRQILAELQSLLDAHDATSKAYAAWRAQIAQERILEKKLANFTRLLGVHAMGVYVNIADLAAFGIARHKTGPKTVAAKLEMVEKAQATRKARGTMGKRQRRKIKGKP